MKRIILIIGLIGLMFMQSCKKKYFEEVPIKNTLELSEEMMSYFVNYEVGTKWIYQDTMDKSNYDTIELISKQNRDVNSGNGYLSKGFVLYYKPKKTKDFKVFIGSGVNNTYYVQINTMVSATGAIVFENNNGTWTTGSSYFDSIEISGIKYYDVIYSKHNNMYQYEMKIAKSKGIIFFIYSNTDPRNPYGGAFKLIKTQKP